MEDFRPVHLHNSFLASYSVKFYFCRQNFRPLLMSAILFFKMVAFKHLKRVITRLQMHLETLFLSLHPHFRCSGSRKRCQYGDPRWRTLNFNMAAAMYLKFLLDSYVIHIFIISLYLRTYNVCKFYLSPKLSSTAHVRHLVFKNGRVKTPKPRYI